MSTGEYKKYIVWRTDGEYEIEDTKEDAFRHAANIEDSEYARVRCIEGPGGEDLTEEFVPWEREWSRKKSEEFVQRNAEYRKLKRVAFLEIQDPRGKWEREEYTEKNVHLLGTEERIAIALFGEDRVRSGDL